MIGTNQEGPTCDEAPSPTSPVSRSVWTGPDRVSQGADVRRRLGVDPGSFW